LSYERSLERVQEILDEMKADLDPAPKSLGKAMHKSLLKERLMSTLGPLHWYFLLGKPDFLADLRRDLLEMVTRGMYLKQTTMPRKRAEAFERNGITTISQVLQKSITELSGLPGVSAQDIASLLVMLKKQKFLMGKATPSLLYEKYPNTPIVHASVNMRLSPGPKPWQERHNQTPR
jgi:hypothetical protein